MLIPAEHSKLQVSSFLIGKDRPCSRREAAERQRNHAFVGLQIPREERPGTEATEEQSCSSAESRGATTK